MMNDYLQAFVLVFFAVDALGMLPLVMAITDGLKKQERRKLMRLSTLTALSVAVIFVLVGRILLEVMGISISDFLVAGGTILFVLSLRDLLSFEKTAKVYGPDVGVVPLAVPLIAGPAVLTSSLVLLNAYGMAPTLFAVISNIIICGVVLNFAGVLSRILGKAGSQTVSKIFSLLLGAIGIMMVRRGLTEIFLTTFPQ